jgi:hypothetical protein
MPTPKPTPYAILWEEWEVDGAPVSKEMVDVGKALE